MESTFLSTKEIEQFQKEGFLGPFPLLEKDEIEAVIKSLYSSFPNLLLPHILARHTVIKEVADFAVQPLILNKIISLLGKDVLLWGSQILEQKGGNARRFHRDAEFSIIEGVAVWVGLKNVVKGETFSVISGSHLLEWSPQELAKKEGLDLMDELAVERAARKLNPQSRLENLEIEDGQFIIFHGKLWHGTKNVSEKRRTAINFRYTIPGNQVLISKNGEIENSSWEKQRPLCLIAAGEDPTGVNKHLDLKKMNRTKSLIKGVAWHFFRNTRRRALNSIPRKVNTLLTGLRRRGL